MRSSTGTPTSHLVKRGLESAIKEGVILCVTCRFGSNEILNNFKWDVGLGGRVSYIIGLIKNVFIN